MGTVPNATASGVVARTPVEVACPLFTTMPPHPDKAKQPTMIAAIDMRVREGKPERKNERVRIRYEPDFGGADGPASAIAPRFLEMVFSGVNIIVLPQQTKAPFDVSGGRPPSL